MQQAKNSGFLERMAGYHTTGNQHNIHGTDDFLPWHRAFLEELETHLQQLLGDCNFALPVWMWGFEVGQLINSPVWAPNRYGALQAGCVSNGFAAGWSYNSAPPGCLQRTPQSNLLGGVLPPVALMFQRLTQNTQYSAMRPVLEGNSHGQFHVMVGGNMGMITVSPREPIFYAHHSYIDMAFWWWSRRQTLYGNKAQAENCGGCGKE
jgi:tyrosinase